MTPRTRCITEPPPNHSRPGFHEECISPQAPFENRDKKGPHAPEGPVHLDKHTQYVYTWSGRPFVPKFLRRPLPRRPPRSTRATLAPKGLGVYVHRVGVVAATDLIRVSVASIVADALAVDRVVGVGGGVRRDVAAPALDTPAREQRYDETYASIIKSWSDIFAIRCGALI